MKEIKMCSACGRFVDELYSLDGGEPISEYYGICHSCLQEWQRKDPAVLRKEQR